VTREGYNVKVLAELLNAKPREIKEFLRGQLALDRTQELQNELLAAGIPLAGSDRCYQARPFMFSSRYR
jgi:hypothetical protein